MMLTAVCLWLLSIPGCYSLITTGKGKGTLLRKEVAPAAAFFGLNSDWTPAALVPGQSETANESVTVAFEGDRRRRRRRRKKFGSLESISKGVFWHFQDFPSGDFCTKTPTCMLTDGAKLSQADFAGGTVSLCQSGKYQLTENIVFDPTPSFPPPDSTTHDVRDGYFIGFFAAISIEGEDIELDCKGYSIQMSESFHKLQRFFSIIELGSRPFISGAGPPPLASPNMSPCKLRTAAKIKIKNCIIGRSSHHGIHGNNAEDVEIKKVDIYNFEVAGIALNGGRKIKIKDVKIGPSIDKTFPSALSQAVFLDRMVNTFGRRDEETFVKPAIENTSVKLRGEIRSGAQIFDELRKDLSEFLTYGSGNLQSLLDIPSSGSAKPDGSAIYGIVIHKTGPAAGAFGNHPLEDAIEDGSMVSDVELEDIEVKGLEVTPQAWISLHMDGAQVQGPAGAVFRGTQLSDGSGKYVGNSLSDAQIAINLVLREAWDRWNASQSDTGLQTSLQRVEQYYNASFIDEQIFEWAAGTQDTLNFSSYNLVCVGDSQSHFNKGAIGIRMDYVDGPRLEDLQVSDIVNSGGAMEDANLCVAENYMGNDAYGIKFTNCIDIDWDDRPKNDNDFGQGLVAGKDGTVYNIDEVKTLL